MSGSRKARPKRSRPRLEPTLALVVAGVGKAVMLEYVAADGRRKVHVFKKGAPLYATRKGDKLIIAGVRVRDKEIHDAP